MRKENRVRQLGGLSGLLAGVLLILVVGTAVAFSIGGGPLGQPWYFGFFELLSGGFVLAIAVLAIPLYLALYLALRESSQVFAPFGSAWGVVGVALLGLSLAYGLGWEVYIGFAFVTVSFFALGAVMLKSPILGQSSGGGSLSLGAAMVFAVMYGFTSFIFFVAALLLLGIFLVLFGWKVYGLSKALRRRADVTTLEKAWKTQPGAIRLLTVSLFLVGSFYVAFTVFVFWLETVSAGSPPQGSWVYWYVGYPSLILTVFGITYIALGLTLRRRTAGAWQQALVASGLASGISVLLSASWLGFLGSFAAIPLVFAIPALALYGLAPAVPASLIGARRHFGIGVREAVSG